MNNILNSDLINATRRNHALEHATIHVLSNHFPGLTLAGHSNPTGFVLLGDLPVESVREAVVEALSRLQNGEHQLAIHDGCGTNYVATSSLAAIFGFMAMSGTRNNRERLQRMPWMMIFSMLAVILGLPFGRVLQKNVTTNPETGSLMLTDVYPLRQGVYRVATSCQPAQS